MSMTVSAPARAWARTHRAVLAIVLLSVALAAAIGLLAARLAEGSSSPVLATSLTAVRLPATDNGCQNTSPGHPC